MLMLGLPVLTKRIFLFRTNSGISINIGKSQLCNILKTVEKSIKGYYKFLQTKNGLSSRLPEKAKSLLAIVMIYSNLIIVTWENIRWFCPVSLSGLL